MRYENLSKSELLAVLEKMRYARGRSPDKNLNLEGLIQALLLRQFELEAQIESLETSQGELQLQRDYYAELYINLPVGLIMLNEMACIEDINAIGATALGNSRSVFLGKPLAAFIELGESIKLSRYLKDCRNFPVQQDEVLLSRRAGGFLRLRLSIRNLATAHPGSVCWGIIELVASA